MVVAIPSSRAAAPQEAGQFMAHYQENIQPLLETYCYDCHGYGMKEGGIAFDELNSYETLMNRELWLKALKNVRAGIMPPQFSMPPEPEELATLGNWIKRDVFEIDPQNPDPGRVPFRRLNRNEYRHTIRELFGYDFDTSKAFPPDDTGQGFDNIARVLSISPMLLDKYMQAADEIVRASVPTQPRAVGETVFWGADFIKEGEGRVRGPEGRDLPTDARASIADPAKFPVTFTVEEEGDYEIQVHYGVYGQFAYDRGHANILYYSEGDQLHKMEHVWQDEKGGKQIEFSYKRHWKPGEKEFLFEIEPLPDVGEEPTGPAYVDPNDPDADDAADQAEDDDDPVAQGRRARGRNAAQGRFGKGRGGPRRTQITFKIVGVRVLGPTAKSQWRQPENYTRFFHRDFPPTDTAERREYARDVLVRFAAKAYRRPVDAASLNALVDLAEIAYLAPNTTFEQGIQQSMIAILASPSFLFRVEDVIDGSPGEMASLIDEYSLASRLSYLLWNSMPDEQLFDLAKRGELRVNLKSEVQRMLADEKSDNFVESFVGQWLRAREVATHAIDPRAVLQREADPAELAAEAKAAEAAGFGRSRRGRGNFNFGNLPIQDDAAPVNDDNAADDATAEAGAEANGEAVDAVSADQDADETPQDDRPAGFGRFGRGRFGRRGPTVQFDEDLRNAMRQETESYFRHVMQEDRSMLELINGDYTFINERLASHYGIEGVAGEEMRKVELPSDSNRGGILTHGSILTVTSQSTRTSAVKRGLFLLDNILGAPAPAAPGDVPPLEASEPDDKALTLRETLEIHRANPVCASCHARMDPLGLVLENYNAMGMFRTKERGKGIVVEGELITGEQLGSVNDLKEILVGNRRDDFYRCIAEKLLIYAIGRDLEYYDIEAIDRIVAQLDEEDGRFSALLMGVVESAPFQNRRNTEVPLAEATSQQVPTVAK